MLPKDAVLRRSPTGILRLVFWTQAKMSYDPNNVKYAYPDTREARIMDKYQCNVCGYIYDPDKGDPSQNIPPGTSFEQLPEDWTCPECGVGKDEFSKV